MSNTMLRRSKFARPLSLLARRVPFDVFHITECEGRHSGSCKR